MSAPRLTAFPAALLLALAACGSNGNPATDDLNDDTSNTPMGAGPVTVELLDNTFKPDKLSVHSGDLISATLVNKGQAPHTFTIKEFDVNKDVPAGQTNTVQFSAQDIGTFKIVCVYHETIGMVGTVEVKRR